MANTTQTREAPRTAAKPRAPRQASAFVAMTRAAFLAQLRSFANIFFGFLFPLVFMAIFGLISISGSNSVSLGIVNGSDVNSPIYQALKAISAKSDSGLSLTMDSQSDLDAKLKSGNLDGVILITPVQRTVTATAPVPSPVASPLPTATSGATPKATPLAGASGTSGSGTPAAPTTQTVQGDDITLTTSLATRAEWRDRDRLRARGDRSGEPAHGGRHDSRGATDRGDAGRGTEGQLQSVRAAWADRVLAAGHRHLRHGIRFRRLEAHARLEAHLRDADASDDDRAGAGRGAAIDRAVSSGGCCCSPASICPS